MDEAEDRPGKVRRMGRLTEPAEEGLLTYGGYLALPELLSLQRLLSDPPVHDELLFITVHQAYELWFKQVVFELEAIRDRMFEGDAERARHYLTRVHAIERVLIEHIEVLQTMSPQDFLEFRSLLSPGVGVPVGAVPRGGVPLGPQGAQVPEGPRRHPRGAGAARPPAR